jgi:SAM-dependent methyltransferase
MSKKESPAGNENHRGLCEGGRLESYGDVSLHRKVGIIIKNRSENKQDIREVAKKEVDWGRVHSMLDLGCGYGCFEQSLDVNLDLLVGIDMHKENSEPFLKNGRRIAADCRFLCLQLPSCIHMSAGSFDFVVCFYSLYFFPSMLAEVRRLLVPGGIFLSITHSERMLEEAELFFRFTKMRKLIEQFSAENGDALLSSYFSSVKWIDYDNQLVFGRDDGSDLSDYITFKKDFIVQDVDPEKLKNKLLRELQARGALHFNKNDRIFIARK